MDPSRKDLDAFGAIGFTRLTAAFYARVRHEPQIAPMYEGDFKGAEKRLCAYLLYRFGFDDAYFKERGHPRLRRRHLPFAIDAAAVKSWLGCMRQAMNEVGISESLDPALWSFFEETAWFMQHKEMPKSRTSGES